MIESQFPLVGLSEQGWREGWQVKEMTECHRKAQIPQLCSLVFDIAVRMWHRQHVITVEPSVSCVARKQQPMLRYDMCQSRNRSNYKTWRWFFVPLRWTRSRSAPSRCYSFSFRVSCFLWCKVSVSDASYERSLIFKCLCVKCQSLLGGGIRCFYQRLLSPVLSPSTLGAAAPADSPCQPR